MLGAPTATGKTQVALALAAELGLEIVSADAMQVYRGMDVGTAKPSPADRARVPHHLIDVVTPDQPFSVAAFVTRAETAIAEVLARGKLPWVVGGSGYYLRSLAAGLPTLPAADPELQAPLWARLEREGLESLVGELDAASSEDAARAQRNPRRVIRALEVLAAQRPAPQYLPQNCAGSSLRQAGAAARTGGPPPPHRSPGGGDVRRRGVGRRGAGVAGALPRTAHRHPGDRLQRDRGVPAGP